MVQSIKDLSDEQLNQILKSRSPKNESAIESFVGDVTGSLTERGIGMIDALVDTQPEIAARLMGVESDKLPMLKKAIETSVTGIRERRGDRGLAGLPGEIIGDPLSVLKATPIIGGAVSGAMLPTIGEESRIANTALGGALSHFGSKIVKGLGGRAERLLSGKTGLPTKRTADQIKKVSQDFYQDAAQKGGVLKSDMFDNFLGELETGRIKSPIAKALVKSDAAGEVTGILKEFKGKNLTLEAFEEVDKVLTDRIDDALDRGIPTPESRALFGVQSAFRDMVEKAKPSDVVGGKQGFDAYKMGRKLYAEQAKMRDLEKIIERAELMDNPTTSLKTGFRQLLQDPKRIRSYTSEERKLIKKAASTGKVEDLKRLAGSGLVRIGSLFSGGATEAAALTGGSILAKESATAGQMAKAGKVQQSISDTVAGVLGEVADDATLPFGELERSISRGLMDRGIMQEGRDILPSVSRLFGDEQVPDNVNPVNSIGDLPDDALNSLLQRRLEMDNQIQQQNTETQAKQGAGTNNPYFDRLAMVESSNNYKAKAPTSSAFGKYQFTAGTAKALVKKYGDKIGVGMDNWQTPENQEKLARVLTEENRAGLMAKLGREPSAGELYAAHFMGISGAKKLLSPSNANKKAATLFPREAKANKNIFFAKNDKGKYIRPRSVMEVREILKRKMEG